MEEEANWRGRFEGYHKTDNQGIEMTFTVKARVRVYGKRGNSVKTFTHKSDAKNHRDALQEVLGHYPEGYPMFYEVLSVRIDEAKGEKP